MIFDLRNEYDSRKFKEYANTLYSKKAVVEIKEKKPQRSLQQNKYCHVLIQYFACEYGCGTDEAKYEFFKKTCNLELFLRTKVNKQGNEIKYMRSTADLTTEEMSLAIERFRNWSSAQAGIFLPSAHDDEFLLHIQKVIEQNKEYI